MAKPRIQARVGEDTKERIENLSETKGIDESEAVRRTLRTGLDEKEGRYREYPQAIAIMAGLSYIIIDGYLDPSGLLWASIGLLLIFSIIATLVAPWEK
jgi:hypothetical protein